MTKTVKVDHQMMKIIAGIYHKSCQDSSVIVAHTDSMGNLESPNRMILNSEKSSKENPH